MRRWTCRLLPMMLLSLCAIPATAAPRIELSVARIEAPTWQARDVKIDWRATPDGGPVEMQARLKTPALPTETRVRLRCERPDFSTIGIGCPRTRLRIDNDAYGRADLHLAARFRSAEYWTVKLASLEARIDHNSADGRLAAEALTLALSGRIERSSQGYTVQARAGTKAGQAYVEPLFLDFAAAPLQLRFDARWRDDSQPLEIRKLTATQTGLATLELSGTLDPRQQQKHHRLRARLQTTTLGTAAATYVIPLLAGTRLQDLKMGGGAEVTLSVENGAVRGIGAQLRHAQLDSTQLGIALDGIDGTLHWRSDGTAPDSQLRWSSGRIVALPIGAAELAVRASARGLQLLAPARIPVLDGALRVQQLLLDGLGTDNLAATLDASLEPIDLALLGHSFGWPEFGGSLSGRLPGLRLENRDLSLDGALTAQVFDGEVTVDQVRIVDPFGVLPRVRADLRLRRLDLEAITSAFSFGRITGRLDGEFDDLRLLGWEPVAMQARLYSTLGDGSRKRISQRAIDNISSIGGGPTGVLSRGALRLFDDFAYARMGWSCVLANGVCRMDGVAPAAASADGQPGYVLVQGRLLPRIDVIGYTRQVNWNTFVRQLAAVRNTQGVEVR